MHICWPPAASEDPAAGAVSGGAYGQWLICSAQPGGRLGHYHTSEKNAPTPFIKKYIKKTGPPEGGLKRCKICPLGIFPHI